MKRLTIIYLTAIIMSSCSLLEDTNPQNGTEIRTSSELTDLLTSATNFRIISFIEEGRNKTAQFSDFRFSFNNDGTVFVTLNNSRINGTYRVFRDDGRLELGMKFPSNSPLYELDDDWYFINRSSNTLTFEDSGDRIVFEF